MRNLKDILLESRLVLGELPFSVEQLINFMKMVYEEGYWDDCDEWVEMEKLINLHYDEKVWNCFKSFTEGWFYNTKGTYEELYKYLEQLPLDRFKRIVGGGSEGILLELDDKKLLKIFYQLDIPKFSKLMIPLNKESKYFPKIYKLGSNWFVIEKLQVHTQKCKNYINIIDEYGWIISNNLKDQDISNLNKLEKEVYEWCVECSKIMISNKIGWPSDLCINNIGERSNGDIVFFDV